MYCSNKFPCCAVQQNLEWMTNALKISKPWHMLSSRVYKLRTLENLMHTMGKQIVISHEIKQRKCALKKKIQNRVLLTTDLILAMDISFNKLWVILSAGLSVLNTLNFVNVSNSKSFIPEKDGTKYYRQCITTNNGTKWPQFVLLHELMCLLWQRDKS